MSDDELFNPNNQYNLNSAIMKKIVYVMLFFSALLWLGGCCIPRCMCDYDYCDEDDDFIYGPEFYYRLSNYTGKDVNENSKLVGNPGIGGYIQWQPKKVDQIRFRTGFRYDLYGSSFNYSSGETTFKDKDRLSYLTVPAFLNYKISDKFRVQAGPDFSLLLGAKSIQKNQDLKTIRSGTDNYNKVQMGLNVEASYNFKHGLEGFVGYSRGLNTIGSGDFNQKIFNNGFYIGTRYRVDRVVKTLFRSHDHEDSGGSNHRYYHNHDDEKQN